MPDIAMCDNARCALRAGCHRFTAAPSPYQSYLVGAAPGADGRCDHYWPIPLTPAPTAIPSPLQWYAVTAADDPMLYVGPYAREAGLAPDVIHSVSDGDDVVIYRARRDPLDIAAYIDSWLDDELDDELDERIETDDDSCSDWRDRVTATDRDDLRSAIRHAVTEWQVRLGRTLYETHLSDVRRVRTITSENLEEWVASLDTDHRADVIPLRPPR